MSSWKTDRELFEVCRHKLFSAVVGDVMDKLGLLHQFLPPRIQPLSDDLVLAGRAMPVLEADVFEQERDRGSNDLLRHPFGLMMEALDDLQAGEVYVCTGASPSYALWGELMSTRAMVLGAAGAVLDGYCRDTIGIRRLGLPVFAAGRYAQDQGPRGKVIDFRVCIEIEHVRIEPGDLLVGDVDGVCVVPRKAERDVLEKALEKATGEKKVKKAIEEGMSAREAFGRYGIM